MANGYINNLPLLTKIIKNFHTSDNKTDILHILLRLDHSQEQLIFNPPEQPAPQNDPENTLLHTWQHLFTTHHGTNAQLHTTMHVALLVQLQLLAHSTNFVLKLTSTFSYAFLYAYTRLQHGNHCTSNRLYHDLRKVEYEYTKLCQLHQLLPYIENASQLQNLSNVAPIHLTTSAAAILFLSEQKPHEY